MMSTTTAQPSSIKYDVDADGIATLLMDIDGQTTNTLGPVLRRDLNAAIEKAVADTSVIGMVIASGKDTFIVGADLKTIDERNNSKKEETIQEVFEHSFSLSRDLRRMETCGKPVAVAINGVAMGGGLEVALACHYRVVADDSRIKLGLPEAGIGLLPGAGGTQRLPRLIGVKNALPIILHGKMASPTEAKELGFVDAVAPLAEIVAEAKRWILEEGDPVARWDKRGFSVPGGIGPASSAAREFGMSNVQLRAKNFGNLTAPVAASAAIFEGLQTPFDTGLQIEGKYFVKLFEGKQSKALIRTLFINKQAADKLARRPKNIAKTVHTKIAVIGAGTMGAGIALNAARAKIEVVLLDTSLEKAQAGFAIIAKTLQKDIERGRSTQAKADELLARIKPSESYTELADVSIVIEAVFESESVKAQVIKDAEAHITKEAVLASNTSAIPITTLAGHSSTPERFIGAHFFSPADRMPLLEIIRGKKTGDEALAKVMDLAQQMRKTPIVVNDGKGFFTSRFIGSFVRQSMQMVEEGIKPALVENAAKMLGMPMGALTVTDSIGLDVGFVAAQAVAQEKGEEFDYKTLGIMGILVGAHDRRGRKNGAGFYDYHEDGSRKLWPGLKDILPTLAQQPSVEQVKERILYAQLAEGARAFGEGILEDPADGDLGATLGVGFPAYLGGPFGAMDDIGISEVVTKLDALAEAHGVAFEAPDLLRQMAAEGKSFYGAAAQEKEPVGFYEQAKKHPERIAIIEDDGSEITFGELLDRANRLSNVFRDAGLQMGDVVASLQTNAAEHFETFFAAFQVGLYMVPVNTHLKQPEIAYILENSGAKAIVASASLADNLTADFKLPALALRVGGAGGEWADYRETLASASTATPTDRVAGRMMVYTSGTTGNPKGVKRDLKDIAPEISAAGTIRYMVHFGMQPQGVQLLFSPVYHGAPAQNVAAALQMGHTVVIMKKFDAETVLQKIEKYGVTGANAVPTHLQRILALPEDVRARYDLSSLENVLVAGAPFPETMKNKMLDWWGPVIWELFAASEGMISVVTPEEAIARPGTLGKPGDAIIVDDEGNVLPNGEIGTIYFKQDQPFYYHNDSEKTKAVTRDDGYATAGDMGYLDADGYLFLRNRRSDLIISGGVNVYPIETEQRLDLHPLVADVAVIGLDDETWGQKVVAVVQLVEGVEPSKETEEILEAWCRDELSSIKVPKGWIFTPKVMRTEVGKLMHRQMRELYSEAKAK